MKKVSFLTIFFLFANLGLSAQETGCGAACGTQTSTGDWQNWVFAGSALVAVIVGVVIISTNTGHFGH